MLNIFYIDKHTNTFCVSLVSISIKFYPQKFEEYFVHLWKAKLKKTHLKVLIRASDKLIEYLLKYK